MASMSHEMGNEDGMAKMVDKGMKQPEMKMKKSIEPKM